MKKVKLTVSSEELVQEYGKILISLRINFSVKDKVITFSTTISDKVIEKVFDDAEIEFTDL